MYEGAGEGGSSVDSNARGPDSVCICAAFFTQCVELLSVGDKKWAGCVAVLPVAIAETHGEPLEFITSPGGSSCDSTFDSPEALPPEVMFNAAYRHFSEPSRIRRTSMGIRQRARHTRLRSSVCFARLGRALHQVPPVQDPCRRWLRLAALPGEQPG